MTFSFIQRHDGSVWEGVFSAPVAASDAATYSFKLKMAQLRGVEGVRNLNEYIEAMEFHSTSGSVLTMRAVFSF